MLLPSTLQWTVFTILKRVIKSQVRFVLLLNNKRKVIGHNKKQYVTMIFSICSAETFTLFFIGYFPILIGIKHCFSKPLVLNIKLFLNTQFVCNPFLLEKELTHTKKTFFMINLEKILVCFIFIIQFCENFDTWQLYKSSFKYLYDFWKPELTTKHNILLSKYLLPFFEILKLYFSLCLSS